MYIGSHCLGGRRYSGYFSRTSDGNFINELNVTSAPACLLPPELQVFFTIYTFPVEFPAVQRHGACVMARADLGIYSPRRRAYQFERAKNLYCIALQDTLSNCFTF